MRWEHSARWAVCLAMGLCLLALSYRPVSVFLHPLRFGATLCREARRNHLEPSLVAALVLRESSYRADARSGVGAVGLMQLMPDTAVWTGRELEGVDVAPSALLDPEVNLHLGTRYLGHLRDRFDGDAVLYLAAFNAGPANVEEWLTRNHSSRLTVEQIPFGETRRYVRSVLECQRCYWQLYRELR